MSKEIGSDSNNCHGGEFVFYPFGPGASPVNLAAESNTAIIMDADSLFHRVEHVGPSNGEFPLVKVGMELRYDGNGIWRLRENGTVVAAYRWEDIRLSISWKAHCFRDEEEQHTWAEHTDDLELELVLDRLVEGLRERGKHRGERPGSREFARLVCDEFYPTPVW